MKTEKHLFDQVVSFENLYKAAKLAQKGKRLKLATLRFNFSFEKELWTLHRELLEKSYQPGKYFHFEIYEPKKRLISAAPYRDRVVHHAIHNILELIFDSGFIFDSYATRKGKGSHKALDQAQTFSQNNTYVLKCDIQKYFPTINHEILMNLIKRKIACVDTLWLIQKILDSHFTENELHQSINQSINQSIGIPIGNLTSQFFANIYLNGFDHFIKEQMKAHFYLRYMDDFLIFSDQKAFLWETKKRIIRYLESLQLKLHENKCRIFKTKKGFPFLGMVISQNRRRLKRENVMRFKRRMVKLQKQYGKTELSLKQVQQSICAWMGHSQHADTVKLRELLLKDIIFQRQTGDGS